MRARRSKRTRNFLCSLCGFNGAAHLRARRLRVDRGLREAHHRFNGAAHLRARRCELFVIVLRAALGFNGAAHLRARRSRGPSAKACDPSASTGPRTCARGDGVSGTLSFVNLPLQRGRALARAEMLAEKAKYAYAKGGFNGAAHLRARRCHPPSVRRHAKPGFNGAAHLRARRFDRRKDTGRCIVVLQRGRALARAEI